MKVQEAIEHLDLFGYCVLEDAIPAEQAERMAERFFAMHEDPGNRAYFQDPDDDLYQTLFGLLNLEEMSWKCAAHPDVLAVARHFLGQDIRLAEACSKWVKPGGARGGRAHGLGAGPARPVAGHALDDQLHLDDDRLYRGDWGDAHHADKPPSAPPAA